METETEGPRFPEVEVVLTGEDGNAFRVIATVRKALIRAGHKSEAEEFRDEAFASGSYEEVLSICNKWVEIL